MRLLLNLNQERGTTLIIVTHDPEVANLTQRTIHLRDGSRGGAAMIILQSIIEALQSLASNKMRSGLTIIGIVIGVAAVISIVSIGRGAENTITGSIQGIGTNLSLFSVAAPETSATRSRSRSGRRRDRRSIPGALGCRRRPDVDGAGRNFSRRGKHHNIDRRRYARIQPVRNVNVNEGEFIQEEHILGRASVVLLGTDVAEEFFDRAAGLVGETVRIEGQPFRVIGVLESKGGSSFNNQDDRIIIPLTTAQTRLIRRSSRDRIDMLAVQAVSADSVVGCQQRNRPDFARSPPLRDRSR